MAPLFLHVRREHADQQRSGFWRVCPFEVLFPFSSMPRNFSVDTWLVPWQPVSSATVSGGTTYPPRNNVRPVQRTSRNNVRPVPYVKRAPMTALNRTLLPQTAVTADFVAPLLRFSHADFHFSHVWDPEVPMTSSSEILEMSNTGQLPLDFTVRTQVI